jgi:hypothetical protein
MGFSFRGKSKGEDSVTNVRTTSFQASDEPGDDVARADLHLRRVKDQHKWDPFMDYDKIDVVDAAIASGDVEKEAAVEQSLLQEDSPYLEVRSSVSPRCYSRVAAVMLS